MKTLYLVRHASSFIDSPTKKDIDRPLNYAGINEAEIMAKYLRKKGRVDLIITSSAERAVTTAQIFAKYFFYPVAKIREETGIYSNTVTDSLIALGTCGDDVDHVLFVGHNPSITLLANELITEPLSSFRTAGIACIEFEIEKWNEIISKGNLKFYSDPSLI